MGFLNMFGLVRASDFETMQRAANKAEIALASAKAAARGESEAAETLRAKLRNLNDEYRDFRAATEDRFRAIAALETKSCARVGKNMARLARAGFETQAG